MTITLIEYYGKSLTKYYFVYDINNKKWVEGKTLERRYNEEQERTEETIQYNLEDAVVFVYECTPAKCSYYAIPYKGSQWLVYCPLTPDEFYNAVHSNELPKNISKCYSKARR